MLIPLYKIWQHSVDSKQLFSSQTNEITVSRDLPDGIRFFGKVILIKQNGTYHLLSSKCTHLGCRINKIENEQLVCPCHGSRYDTKGNPLTGPAVRPLGELDFEMDEKNGNISIRFVQQ
jgi:Rieske Fe-S protein